MPPPGRRRRRRRRRRARIVQHLGLRLHAASTLPPHTWPASRGWRAAGRGRVHNNTLMYMGTDDAVHRGDAQAAGRPLGRFALDAPSVQSAGEPYAPVASVSLRVSIASTVRRQQQQQWQHQQPQPQHCQRSIRREHARAHCCDVRILTALRR
ncbi:hypothetical protein P280DRAFT_236052 [Massarina eburnea CBS 473.64]|uniref:Uncharacterized protein n=1 Tax=Massarina eburnea CBS 473.64 TaxID=1395130 RepID=A0A6A6RJJ7_9PLEO|nr:hypothetical protein P280DRAFT_236052 [Massarina eburnea CBS 473.64]